MMRNMIYVAMVIIYNNLYNSPNDRNMNYGSYQFSTLTTFVHAQVRHLVEK